MLQAETRKLAAIMFTDMVGFSRQMGADKTRMLRVLEAHNQILQQAVTEHQGHVIKTMGDAFLVDFPSVVHAVQCAQHIQAQFRTHNAEKETNEQIHIRIGIHLGDIVQRDGDVFGDGVNVASRLQTLAEPDTICISQVVYQEVEKKLPLGTVVSLGRLKLKKWQRAFQVAAIVLLLVGAEVFVRNLYVPASPALALPDKPSIAGLPFVNMSEDPQQEYFSDGITEDLITDLSKLSGLFIISRNSVFTYKGKRSEE